MMGAMAAFAGFPEINLLAGWIGLVLGFVTGFLLGLKFHDPEWKGGYLSFERRMIRLAHISLFGLAIINLLFYFTVRSGHWNANSIYEMASWAFIVGAITMPLCCLAMAKSVKARPLFVIPVLSLTIGGALTLYELVASRALTTP